MAGLKPTTNKLTVIEGADAAGDPAELAARAAVEEAKLSAEAAHGTGRSVELMKRRQRHKPRGARALRGVVGR